MSRIGRAPIAIPASAKVTLEGPQVLVEGPKGKLSLALPPTIRVQLDGQQLRVESVGDEQNQRALHGLYRAMLANMVRGVADGFSKELEITGVGYRAQIGRAHV